MDCEFATRRIPACLHGELSLDDRAALNEHLSSCPSCRQEMADMRQTMAAMAAHREVRPEFSVADVKSRARERNARRGWFLPAPRWATVLGAVVAILVGAVGGIGLHVANQPVQTQMASGAVSDILGLGASDDPVANLMAEMPPDLPSTPARSGREAGL